MSEKKGLLPSVHEDIGHAVQAEYTQNPNYIVEILQRLNEDNPCIASFIGHVTQGKSNYREIAEACIFVYRLLESQAESDKMKRELGLEDRC